MSTSRECVYQLTQHADLAVVAVYTGEQDLLVLRLGGAALHRMTMLVHPGRLGRGHRRKDVEGAIAAFDQPIRH